MQKIRGRPTTAEQWICDVEDAMDELHVNIRSLQQSATDYSIKTE